MDIDIPKVFDWFALFVSRAIIDHYFKLHDLQLLLSVHVKRFDTNKLANFIFKVFLEMKSELDLNKKDWKMEIQRRCHTSSFNVFLFFNPNNQSERAALDGLMVKLRAENLIECDLTFVIYDVVKNNEEVDNVLNWISVSRFAKETKCR